MSTDPATAVERAILSLDPPPGESADGERARIEEIKSGVDLTSANSVLDFGAASERRVGAFADSVLDQVLGRDLGPMHDKLSELRQVAGGLDPERLKGGGLLNRLFFDARREVDRFADSFRSARQRIDAIAGELEDRVDEVGLGIALLDRLFEENLETFRELSLHIAAGHELLAHYADEVIPAAEAEARARADQPDGELAAQKVRDLKAAVDRLDRKVMNLEKSKAIAHAAMPTIRQVQQTGITLIEELRMAIAHAIPAWKSTMLIHVEQMRQKVGLAALDAMTEFTNAQLKTMAQQLDSNVEAAHKQSRRGIADVAAITETIDSLLATLDRIDRLDSEARRARAEGRKALAEAERSLRQRQIQGPAAT